MAFGCWLGAEASHRARGVRGGSVGEAHLWRVAQFVQGGVAGQLHHRGWPTEQQQHVLPRSGQMLPDHVRGDKALAVGPTCMGRGEHHLPEPRWPRGAVWAGGGCSGLGLQLQQHPLVSGTASPATPGSGREGSGGPLCPCSRRLAVAAAFTETRTHGRGTLIWDVQQWGRYLLGGDPE